MSRKDLYDKALENSAVSWSNLYREEKKAREELEERYNLLVQKIKEQGRKKVDDGEHYVDYGAGKREVQHIMKGKYPPDSFEKEYWAKLRELPDDEI